MESERDRLIRAKAYQLWEEGGRVDGNAEEHWSEAERSVAAGSEAPPLDAPGSSEPAAARKSRKTAAAVPAEASPAGAAKAPRAPTKGRAKGGTAEA